MRHRVKGKKLSRTSSHRKATMQALAMALIREHRIVTTVTKAKALRGYIEPLITRAKVDNLNNRREVFSSLQNKEAVKEIFATVGPKVGDRPGGYTRVIKAGFRVGDSAEMAIIELVDFNDIQPEGKETKKKKTRRAGKAAKTTTAAPAKDAEVVEEVKAEEVSEETADAADDDVTSGDEEEEKK